MEKQDYIHTSKSGHKINIVSLVPNEPKRILLIPPLVGATGTLAIRTFRYFFRENGYLMSFQYCGHSDQLHNQFTITGTFVDTKEAILHAIETGRKLEIPVHVVGACYGLIPLICVLHELKWPREVKSLFSVGGLFSMHELINFDGYSPYLKKRGITFKNKTEFIEYMKTEKSTFVKNKKIYTEALTEYLISIFDELKDVISYESFGVMQYSNVDFYKAFYEFITIDLPKVTIPSYFPCLFFTGVEDHVLKLETATGNSVYTKKITAMAPHAQFRNIKIDHFGRGEDHYVIGEDGMKFLLKNEKLNVLEGVRDGNS